MFTYRSARSGALVAGFGLAIVVETVLLHLWLVGRHPIVAWVLTASSISVLVWLVADYRAMGRGAIRVTGDVIDLRIGTRFAAELPLGMVTHAGRATWRELPEPGTPAAAGYINMMKPATPNVLLALGAPVTIRASGGLRRSAVRIGLCVDAPEDFLAAVQRRTP